MEVEDTKTMSEGRGGGGGEEYNQRYNAYLM